MGSLPVPIQKYILDLKLILESKDKKRCIFQDIQGWDHPLLTPSIQRLRDLLVLTVFPNLSEEKHYPAHYNFASEQTRKYNLYCDISIVLDSRCPYYGHEKTGTEQILHHTCRRLEKAFNLRIIPIRYQVPKITPQNKFVIKLFNRTLLGKYDNCSGTVMAHRSPNASFNYLQDYSGSRLCHFCVKRIKYIIELFFYYIHGYRFFL